MEHIARKAAQAEKASEDRVPRMLDPLFIGGHWVPEMIALAGASTARPSRGEIPSYLVGRSRSGRARVASS